MSDLPLVRARATWLFAAARALPFVAACSPHAMVGTYDDAGGRCDPLAPACPDTDGGLACTLRADPALDACRSTGALALGGACTALDACGPDAQCARRATETASLDPADLASGAVCARVCARDAPVCAAGQRCLGIASGDGGVRVDYGVCGP